MKTYEYFAPVKVLQNPNIEEAERYRIIINYFWENAVVRLRYNDINKRYFSEIKQRLSELEDLQDELEGLQNTKDLCSSLLKRMSATHLKPK